VLLSLSATPLRYPRSPLLARVVMSVDHGACARRCRPPQPALVAAPPFPRSSLPAPAHAHRRGPPQPAPVAAPPFPRLSSPVPARTRCHGPPWPALVAAPPARARRRLFLPALVVARPGLCSSSWIRPSLCSSSPRPVLIVVVTIMRYYMARATLIVG
jgi:hypothetical protein